MKPSIALTCLVVLMTVATGCGGSGEDASSTTQAGVAPETADGGSAGGDGLPESVADDFGVDIPAGWEIDLLGELGMTNTSGVQLLYPADSFSNLVGFYDDWTEDQSEEYARTDEGDLVIYTGSESVYTISLTRGHEERDQTWTLLQVITPGS